MHVENPHNYYADFKIPVKCATMKMTIAIDNGRSLKLRQTRQVDTSHPLQVHNRPQPGGLAYQ